MSRYIDEDDAIRTILMFYGVKTLDGLIDAIKYLPTVDVTYVVMCKDCKHRMIASSEEGTHYHYCAKHDHAIDTDWFCADGRRENASE